MSNINSLLNPSNTNDLPSTEWNFSFPYSPSPIQHPNRSYPLPLLPHTATAHNMMLMSQLDPSMRLKFEQKYTPPSSPSPSSSPPHHTLPSLSSSPPHLLAPNCITPTRPYPPIPQPSPPAPQLCSSSSSIGSSSSSHPTPSSSSSSSSSSTSSSLKSNISKKMEKKKENMKEMILEEQYLRMKQSDAAFHLGFAATTFSKRWRASLPKRKWPFRKHVKLLNTIKDLKSMQQRGQDVQAYLVKLMKEKKENLSPAVIYYYEKDIVTRSRGYDDDDEDDDDEEKGAGDVGGDSGEDSNL